MPGIFVAGATGYLGRRLCRAFRASGLAVTALVRDRERAGAISLDADRLVEAEATDPAALGGSMAGCDTVISALGITRQTDGLTYRDVDYQANLNLLREAEAAGITRFAYVHVFNGALLARESALARAKQDFVEALEKSPLAATVIAPTGYFSDMESVFDMARKGRVFLFGDGSVRVNPIDGDDLAAVCVDAVQAGAPYIEAGGPDIMTFDEIGQLAFEALGRKPRFLHMPYPIADGALKLIRRVTPQQAYGPFEFFVAASRSDMVAPCHGTLRLADHFRALAAAKA
ncbi:SDR family oxidoreductase [Martelella endophytica]|uniref:3-beta hydroxysteroid dehydrogenase n=1 Tax=Martelella endophytica TaxID=1486262 RepID=A0A0D5LTG4_MAREN|nr:SDR family oxidoreductase [Martelella endophytica]AJY47484.1 3-beta hydroxysteroid dehydrogenase [Martelella endophytica]